MANLPETPDYPAGVYQLETSDPVLGGPGGIANRQSEQLGNRTAWLKAKVDAFIDGTVAVLKATKLATARTLSISGAGSGSASFDGSANATIALTLADSGAVAGTYPKVTITAKGIVTGGAALVAADIPNLDWSKINSGKPTTLGGYGITDAAPLASPDFTGNPLAPTPPPGGSSTSIVNAAALRRSVAGRLVKSVAGGATVALTAAECDNVLLEFTGALTANIAVTVPAASGAWTVLNRTSGAFTLTVKTPAGTGVVVSQGKQRVLACDGTNVFHSSNDFDSTAFTGNPSAPTPAQFDNDSSLATTEFVQRALGNFAGATVLSAATTLTASDTGKAFSLNPGASVVLPLFAAVPKGAAFIILNADGAASKTITRQGADTIFAPDATNFPSSAVTSITLLPGEWVCITANSQWQVVSGSVWNRVSSGPFGAALATSGYQKLPSGLIIQWGQQGVAGSTTTTYSFPIAFPNAAFHVIASTGVPGSSGGVNADVVSAAQYKLQNLFTSTEQKHWFAIGY